MYKFLSHCLIATSLVLFSVTSYALNEVEAEELADLTAVFVFLRNDCGLKKLEDDQIRDALIHFIEQNQWSMGNYVSFNMTLLGEESYRDLKKIAVPTNTKCQSLIANSSSLLAYHK